MDLYTSLLIIILIIIIILVIVAGVFTKIAISNRDYDKNCNIDIEGLALAISMALLIILIIIMVSFFICNYNNCSTEFYMGFLIALVMLVIFMCGLVPAHKKLKKQHKDVRLLRKWKKTNDHDEWEQSAIDLKFGKKHKVRQGLEKLKECNDCECVGKTFSFMFD